MDLIESIPVEFEQIDKVITPFSTGLSGRRETINHIERKSKFTLDAQVVFGNQEQIAKHSNLGTSEQIKGYCVLKVEDINAKGVTLKRGDKISKIGDRDMEVYLLHSSGDLAAHFNSIGSFTLVRMFFGDRNVKG